ncbi:MAG TPA: hypothetical protein VMF66_07755 [Candidatus Acidoferrum sp.]|nr:hypothetical protein [Candidatus Acidoferrum sp.]
MQNAHERFGVLEFTKRTKDITTRVRVHIDRAVLEPAMDDRGQARAHLLSVIGGDSEIGALWAALAEAAVLRMYPAGHAGIAVCLGPEAQCFRGSVVLPGRTRPVRHLVAVSAELAKTKPGTDHAGARTILSHDDPLFIFYRIAYRYGLPVLPEWAPWFMQQLKRRKAVQPLVGLACSPVLVNGMKQTFLAWIGKALKEGSIRFPEQNGPISWSLPVTFFEGPSSAGLER